MYIYIYIYIHICIVHLPVGEGPVGGEPCYINFK